MTLAAIVLCGGQSKRMGLSKAWLPFGPERLLQRVVRLASSVADPIVVVAAPGQELPVLPPSASIVRDPVAHRGPLQGLFAGLAALPESANLVYVTSTDVPFLNPRWMTALADLIESHDMAIPHVEGFDQPLAAVYRRATVLPAAERLLAADRLRPVFLKESLNSRIVTADELRSLDLDFATLRNLNEREDYLEALYDSGFGYDTDSVSQPTAKTATIVIEFFGVPRLRAGVAQLVLEANTLGEAIKALGNACPQLRESVLKDEALHPAYTINLNGAQFVSDPNIPLASGDTLILVSVDIGG